MRRGGKNHDHDTCTQGSEQRPKTTEKVLSSKKILPVLHRFEYKDRIQRSADVAGFYNRERQDHAAAHYGKLRKTPAGIDRGHQEGADDRPAALCCIRRINGFRQPRPCRRCAAVPFFRKRKRLRPFLLFCFSSPIQALSFRSRSSRYGVAVHQNKENGWTGSYGIASFQENLTRRV